MESEEAPMDVEQDLDVEDVASIPLVDALSIVGEETRATIIHELGESRVDDGVAPEPLGFSELMERTDVADSGLFNYHLEKLAGTFVESTDEGYVLSFPGQLFHRALVAGTLTDRRSVDPFDVGDCVACGGTLEATYRPDHLFTVRCAGCERLLDAMHLPARALEGRSRQELVDAAYRRRFHAFGTMRRGVCHGCGGRVSRDLSPADGEGSLPCCDRPVHAVLRCDACHASFVGNPAVVALAAPAVVGFFADHGRDVADARAWDAPVADATERVAVDSESPITASTAYVLGDERLRIVVDDDLQVVESARHDA